MCVCVTVSATPGPEILFSFSVGHCREADMDAVGGCWLSVLCVRVCVRAGTRRERVFLWGDFVGGRKTPSLVYVH